MALRSTLLITSSERRLNYLTQAPVMAKLLALPVEVSSVDPLPSPPAR